MDAIGYTLKRTSLIAFSTQANPGGKGTLGQRQAFFPIIADRDKRKPQFWYTTTNNQVVPLHQATRVIKFY